MQVILVDEHDLPLGAMEKLEAHRRARLHRAFSVFVFNDRQEMLLQQRAGGKYHSGGLWSNACCSHPAPGQDLVSAAQKRLQEEMGFTTPLQKAFCFTYRADMGNGLTEHEFDHVLIGTYSGNVQPDPEEVGDYCYKSMEEIRCSLSDHPDQYTAWFKIAFPRLERYLLEAQSAE
jgi:isopentenyl-diphosphate delta-isomerase